MTARETKDLRDICIFVVRFYIKVWFRSTSAAKAANLDFTYLREMHNYKETDKKLSAAVVDKICNHLWYLSEERIAFSFFDLSISSVEKRKMVQRLNELNHDEGVDVEINKRIKLNIHDVGTFVTKQVSDFITPNTANLFDRFNIPKGFLDIDPDMWQNDDDWVSGMEIVRQIKVVNDSAERGVKLIQDYNKKLTRREDEMQYLLQVVKDYHHKFPSYSKQSLRTESKPQ